MTEVPLRLGGFGRVLGETARSAQALHLRTLQESGSDFNRWVTFTVLREHGGDMTHDELASDLTDRLGLPAAAIDELLDRLASSGFLDLGEHVVLTEAGLTNDRDVREAVNRITERLLADVDSDDIATTVRVLENVGVRARSL